MDKKLAIALVTMIMLVGGLMGFLGLTFVNSKDCSQIVIDTNEIHSGINIPEVDFINCYFDAQKKIRLSIYQLKQKDYYRSAYAERFRRIDTSSFSGISQLEIQEQPTTNTLLEARGMHWGNAWRYVHEPETGILWVEIRYE